MRQNQIRRLAHDFENALLQDVEARMQIEPVRLDANPYARPRSKQKIIVAIINTIDIL